MRSNPNIRRYSILAGILIGGVFCSNALAQASPEKAATGSQPAGTPATATAEVISPAAAAWHARESSFYKRNWGVDIVGVKAVSSGYNLRFSYRILDAAKAKQLNDKAATPVLIDQATGAQFVVPQMPKVGQLRQTATPKVGRTYWMIFANGGKVVKPGARVDIVIGNFRATGLVVE